METTAKTDVVIIGAGPTGLSLASQLVRFGIHFVILDKNEGITPYSKALGVQARTLEIFDQLDLAQEAIARGAIARKARLLVAGEIRGELDFSNVGEALSPFPFVLMLEQSKNEQLLYEFLAEHEKNVCWNTQFEDLWQTDGGIAAQVRTSAGAHQVIKARYLVGCDGPKSLVRHALGLTFEGSTFERIFYVADAQIDWQLGHDALHVCFAEGSFVVFFPLKGEKRYRIVGVLPEEFGKDEGEILYEEIEARIKDETRLELDIHDVEWFSTYKVHTRHVNEFYSGRGFLAGDAAHVHTPAGAQGMNTGIQDAYNLAWKLAMVLRGKTDETLLDTYNEERLENAKHLLKTTDRLFEFAAGTELLLAFIRTEVLPPVAKQVFSFDPIRKFVFKLISQIGISYRHSSLSDHAGDENFEVKAGDRMPYFLINGESVYDKLREPRFHWLLFTSEDSESRQSHRKAVDEGAQLIDVNTLPISPRVEEIFGTSKAFEVLLRPDNHVAFITPETRGDRLKPYFSKVLGCEF